MSKVQIHKEVCKGCSLCVEYCPKKILRLSEDTNSAGYNHAECINEKECIACGFCYTVCPDCAITIK